MWFGTLFYLWLCKKLSSRARRIFFFRGGSRSRPLLIECMSTAYGAPSIIWRSWPPPLHFHSTIPLCQILFIYLFSNKNSTPVSVCQRGGLLFFHIPRPFLIRPALFFRKDLSQQWDAMPLLPAILKRGSSSRSFAPALTAATPASRCDSNNYLWRLLLLMLLAAVRGPKKMCEKRPLKLFSPMFLFFLIIFFNHKVP